LSCFYLASLKADDERIWIEAKINNKPVRFFVDTGSGNPIVLYSTAVKRLGLKTMPSPPSYHTVTGIVEKITVPVDLDIASIKESAYLPVYKVPNDYHWPEDGVIGWPYIRQHFNQYPLLLDLATNKLEWLTNLPAGIESWSKFPLQTNLNILALQISRQNDKASLLIFDTGAYCGVKLGHDKFHEWTMHTNGAITLDSYMTSYGYPVIAALEWAKDISVGSLKITDVPVEGADPNEIASGTSTNTQFVATFGLAALKRLEIIIDNQNNIVYLRPKKTQPLPYEHNRLGAVFAPKYPDANNNVAYVITGSPAYEAGIRDGDILLNPEAIKSYEQPAGTKINLKLKRGDKIFKTTATLRNLLPLDAATNSN